MTIRKLIPAVAAIACLALGTGYAEKAKTYQVTGPVLEMSADSITVQKGKDPWQIARDATTKMEGDVKVGTKVTIEYRMTATSVEAKEAKGAAKASPKKAKK